MSSSDKYDAESIRKMQVTAAQVAAHIPQYKFDTSTINAMTELASAAQAFSSHRDDMIKHMSPVIESFNQMNSYKMDTLGSSLARTAADLAELNTVKYQLASSQGMQALAEAVRSAQNFNSLVSPDLTRTMREVINTSLNTEQFTRSLLNTPGIADAIRSTGSLNTQVTNFADVYRKSLAPVMETLRNAYEQTNVFDDFDFSILDDVDEDAFEDFLDEHPELEETYASIEEQLVGQGLISKETFAKAGSRFKSSRVARHLMIALIMFSAAATITFAVKKLPDDLESDAILFLGITGFLYTAYAVHSTVKKAVNPKPATE